MKKYSVYVLSDPSTSEPKYVGMSCNLKQRMLGHSADSCNEGKKSWIKSLKEQGLSPVVDIVKSELKEAEARIIERDTYIRLASEGHTLLNSKSTFSGAIEPLTRRNIFLGDDQWAELTKARNKFELESRSDVIRILIDHPDMQKHIELFLKEKKSAKGK